MTGFVDGLELDPYQDLLFGEFPRAVGTNAESGQLNQFVVHSAGEFAVFLDRTAGKRNPYASLSWRPLGGELRLSTVSIDFDTPEKPDWPVFGARTPDVDEMISLMRTDEDVADAVLYEPLADARTLALAATEESIPVFAVFTGLGFHVHLCYQEKTNPDKQIDTTAKRFVSELDLHTADAAPIGDTKRIMRVPNMERVHVVSDGRRLIEQRATGCYTIPLSVDDLDSASPSDVLELATAPRNPPLPDLSDRPEMQHYPDYARDAGEDMTERDLRKLDTSVLADRNDEMLTHLLEECLQMPCMVERIQQPEPEHFVRQNSAVLLFNAGFTPHEVADIFQSIGWRDFDRQVTVNQLEQIYRRGYSDASCKSIRERALCVFGDKDERRECPCYGWSNGEPMWKQ